MAITELGLPEFNQGRRDLFTFASSRRNRGSGGNQPPRRPTTATGSSNLPPEDPSFWNKVLNRRTFIGAAATLAVGGTALYVAEQTGLINLVPNPELPPLPDTLEGLVQEAQRMEASFSENDLTNKEIRNRYTEVIARIYEKDAPKEGWTADRMVQSLVWADGGLDDFISLVKQNYTNPPDRGREYFFDVAGVTTNHQKVVINAKNPAFNTALLRRTSGIPKDWNGLRSLRLVLFHEFVHLTTDVKHNPEIFSLTDIPQYENSYTEGFRLAYDEQGRAREIFRDLDETAVETVTEDRNNRLFGFTPSYIYEYEGVSISAAKRRMRQVLDATGISVREFESLNRQSDPQEFFLLLASKAGLHPDLTIPNRINYAVQVSDAIVYGDQAILQDYISRAQFK